jgi:hypothetical protein
MTFKSTFQAQFLRRSGPIKVGLKDAGLNDRAWTSHCCRMNPAFPIPFLWLIIASAESSKMFHFPKLISTVWNLQFSLVTIDYLASGTIYVWNV